MALLVELKTYIDKRNEERSKFSIARCASSLFAAIGIGISYSDKRAAWETIQAIKKDPEEKEREIPKNQLKALNDSRLKEVILRNKHDLPNWFIRKFDGYRKEAAALEKRKFEAQQRRIEYFTIR